MGITATQEGVDAIILFTHDLHCHFLPAVDEDGGEYGGYARLMTVIRQQKTIDPNAILVDGGAGASHDGRNGLRCHQLRQP